MSIQLYVDGSWKPSTPNKAGWAYIIVKDNTIIAEDLGSVQCLSRQIDGELFATLKAFDKVMNMKFKEIELYYDYIGIEKWATGKWKAKSQVAKDYIEELKRYDDILSVLTFKKVSSHKGESEGNDIVDQMAKDGLLLELSV